jgi:hypothetical protein
MWPLTQLLVDIALHRRAPADLPASQFVFGCVLAGYFAIALSALQIGATMQRPAMLLLFDSAFFLTSVWLILALFNQTQRYLQTVTAMVGTDLLLTLVGLPLLLWNSTLQASPTEITTPQLFLLLLFFWSVDIGGYVLSKALGRSYIVGVFIMIVYVLVSMTSRQALFPAAS